MMGFKGENNERNRTTYRKLRNSTRCSSLISTYYYVVLCRVGPTCSLSETAFSKRGFESPAWSVPLLNFPRPAPTHPGWKISPNTAAQKKKKEKKGYRPTKTPPLLTVANKISLGMVEEYIGCGSPQKCRCREPGANQ